MKPKSTYLIPLIVTLILIVPSLVQMGMFFDGLTYASISRNLSIGEGDFFHLHYTDLHGGVFYDHPPLFFGIQSVFFSVLGDHWWVEKLFCFIFLALNAFLIHRIIISCQKLFYKENKISSWPVIMIWLLVPITFWVYKNNVLEILLTTFTLLSVLCFLRMLSPHKTIYGLVLIFCFSLSVLFAFLTKGFVGLFPLALPVIYFLVFYPGEFKSFLKLSAFYFIAAFFLVSFWLILNSDSDFRDYFSHYFNEQLGRSLSGERETADFRFKTFTDLLFNFSFLLLYSFVFLLIFRSWKNQKSYELKKPVIYFLLIGLSASLPILISPKQREMYLAPSIPYFAIAVYFYFHENWNYIEEKLTTKNFRHGIYLLLIAGLVYNGILAGKISRDKEIIEFLEANKEKLQNKTQVCDQINNEEDWKLIAYFQRYGRVTLMNKNTDCETFLVKTEKGWQIITYQK